MAQLKYDTTAVHTCVEHVVQCTVITFHHLLQVQIGYVPVVRFSLVVERVNLTATVRGLHMHQLAIRDKRNGRMVMPEFGRSRGKSVGY